MINRALANRIEVWADKQFPQATQLSRANHLRMETGIGDITEEVGDCMSLLLHIITHGNINIEAELERKLKINRERDWKEPNEKGFTEHARASEE